MLHTTYHVLYTVYYVCRTYYAYCMYYITYILCTLYCILYIRNSIKWYTYKLYQCWGLENLVFLGMFYNLFLPGGIGGDAYKAYVLKKYNPNSSNKRTITVLILDRISGLFALFSIGIFVLASLKTTILNINSTWSILLLASGLLCYKLIINKGFAYTKTIFWSTILYSLFVQGLQVIAILCILKGLNISTGMHPYVLVFLCSSIVSIIPLTIGGIGSRELTFVYGAQWFNLSEEKSLGTSMLFFILNALVSLIGIYYYFNSIEFKKDLSGLNSDKRSPDP